MTESDTLGAIRITPGVIRTIATLTARATPGVAAVGQKGAALGLGLPSDPVKVEINDGVVTIELDIRVSPGANAIEVGRTLQSAIAAAVENAAEMKVDAVKIRIHDAE